MLQCFVIDRNRFKQRSKTMVQNNERLRRLETAIKRSVIESSIVYTNKTIFICVACIAHNDMFSCFNTATQSSVRESKRKSFSLYRYTILRRSCPILVYRTFDHTLEEFREHSADGRGFSPVFLPKRKLAGLLGSIVTKL